MENVITKVWRLWAKALGEKSGTTDSESDLIAIIRTVDQNFRRSAQSSEFPSLKTDQICSLRRAVTIRKDSDFSVSRDDFNTLERDVDFIVMNVHILNA